VTEDLRYKLRVGETPPPPHSAVETKRSPTPPGQGPDPLTKLFNRAAVDEQTGRVLGIKALAGQPACLFMVDIDHFKNVNDSYGHPAGDAVLKGLAGLRPGEPTESLLKRADSALYEAKKRGRTQLNARAGAPPPSLAADSHDAAAGGDQHPLGERDHLRVGLR